MKRGLSRVLLAGLALLLLLAACRALLRPPLRTFPNRDARELAHADDLSKLGNWDAAGPIYASLERIFKNRSDRRNEIYAHVSRFGLEEESSDLQKVSQELRATLLLPVVQSDLQLKQRCLEIKAHIDLNLDGVSARPSLEELERVARQRKDADAESRASGELGILAFLEGNPAEARNRIVKAIGNSFLHHDLGAQMRYLSLLGQGLAENHEPKEALWPLDRALSISQRTPDAGFQKLVVSGKTSALTQLGRFAEARAIIEQGLRYAKSHGYIGFEVDMLSQSGQLAVAENKSDDAIRLYERAVTLARQIRFNRGLAEVNAKLASLYQKAGNLPQAERSEMASIEARSQMGEVYELPHHLVLEASLQQALGSPDAARNTYLTAERIVGTMLRNSPTAGIKKSVVSAMSEIYLGHFRLSVANRNVEEAYSVIENARGRVAADRLRSADNDRRPRSEISSAERRLALLQIRLLNAQNQAERNRLSDSLTEAEQQSVLDEDSPPFTNLRERPKLGELQAVLHPNEAVLEYVIDDPASFCLLITTSRVEVVRLPSRKHIEDLVERYLSAIRVKSLAVSEGHQLYSAVVEPLEKLIQNMDLVVVPDGALHRVPFAALVDNSNLYLLQTHIIDYAPSSTVLFLFRRSHSSSQKKLLAVGNVSYGDEARPKGTWSVFRGLESLSRKALMPLPATQDEVESVAATMRDVGAVILSGKNATESNFKREAAKGVSVIHVAVHAFADKDHPDRAGLVFAADDSGEDGLLQVREIRRLSLRGTMLVTLSACDTSAGRLEGEEGVSSIVSAFLYAGARTAVTSFWPIEDSSTSELMKVFYRDMAHGQSKASALRAAQLELLRRGGQTNAPFFWAAFGLTGDGSGKIQESTSNDKRGT